MRCSKPRSLLIRRRHAPHPIPAHAFHSFQIRIERGPWPPPASRLDLRCACSLTCWEHRSGQPRLRAITSVRPETVTTVPPTPVNVSSPEPDGPRRRGSFTSGRAVTAGGLSAGEVSAASTTSDTSGRIRRWSFSRLCDNAAARGGQWHAGGSTALNHLWRSQDERDP